MRATQSTSPSLSGDVFAAYFAFSWHEYAYVLTQYFSVTGLE